MADFVRPVREIEGTREFALFGEYRPMFAGSRNDISEIDFDQREPACGSRAKSADDGLDDTLNFSGQRRCVHWRESREDADAIIRRVAGNVIVSRCDGFLRSSPCAPFSFHRARHIQSLDDGGN